MFTFQINILTSRTHKKAKEILGNAAKTSNHSTMEKDLFQDIKQMIEGFQASLAQHLPALEAEVNQLIQTKNQDKNTIEYTLDTLLSLTGLGVGKELFVRLLEYYKTIDSEGAAFYWNEYDQEE
jgi:DNA replication initiation complex subunit (GINS family)